MAKSVGFTDRDHAGRVLGSAVAEHLDRAGRRSGPGGRPLVLALPRGGVPVGAQVARAVDGDLDVVVARKIGVPGYPELGVGAVGVDGPPVFDAALLQRLGLHPGDLAPAVQRERAEALRRLRRYRRDRPPVDVSGRLVVVVDDGLATGVTARAALRSLRQRDPAYLAFAAPVCAQRASAALATEADAVVCVRQPGDFRAVGRWYHDFAQMTDDQVEHELHRAWSSAITR
jgi:predicted phosphoribosyltransferase